ncbi:MAG TPA: hypothetical protein VER96_39145 [Polyangiaceae bacterium]|nr:hypothetical protein [Polyangiaceae bacterium]
MAEQTHEEFTGQRRWVSFLTGAVGVLAIAGAIATWQWRVAVGERQNAERGLKEGLAAAETVIARVDGELKGVRGAEELRGTLIAEASNRLDRLAAGHGNDVQLSRLLEHLQRGTLAGQALDVVVAERELSAAERLIPQVPTNRQPRGETLIYRARCELALDLQEYAEALSCLNRAEQLARTWAASGLAEARLQLAEILRMRGDARFHGRTWNAASADYREAESLIEQLRRAGPDTANLTLAAAAVQQRMSRVEEVARSTEGVLDRLMRSTHLLERVAEKELATQGLVQLIEVYQRLAVLCTRWHRDALAKSFGTKAHELARALYVSSPQNIRYQLALAAAEEARGKDALAEERVLRATLFFARESDLLETLVERETTNTQARRDYFGALAMLLEALVEQKRMPEASEEFARLDSAVREFVDARIGTASDEALAVGIRGFSLLANAALQVDRPKARIEASERSFQLAKQRFAKSPSLGDAQMDLFIAHGNMILAATMTRDTSEMEAHAREARRLTLAENSIEPEERELVTGVQKLIARVLDPVAPLERTRAHD